MTNYQYPWQVIPPRETDRIDSSWTVVFLSHSRGPNRISHEKKDLLTMKSSQVGERDRTAGRGHGRRVKKTAKMEEKGSMRMSKREREREEGKRTTEDKRREQRSYERVPVCLTVRCRVVGARLAVSLSACQPTHVGTVATGDRVWIHTPTPHAVAARTTRPCRTRIVTTRERYFVCM